MPRIRLIVTLVGLFASLVVVATPAAARTAASKRPADTVLSSSQLKLTSSTGRTLWLSVFVDRFAGSPGPAETSLEVGLGDGPGESHLWQLNVSNQTFSYAPKGHQGSVRTGASQIAPLGHVSLSIAPRGASRSHQCSRGDSWVKQPVALTGIVVFKTHSAAWGRVGSARHPLTFKGRSMVETDYGNLEHSCFGGGSPACSGSVDWDSPGGIHGGFDGWSYRSHGKQRGAVDFSTEHSLAAPAGASIDNDAYVITGSPPTLVTRPDGTKVLTIRAGSHGLITGSATMHSSRPPTTRRGVCRGGATKVWSASYKNGKRPLTAHLAIGGTVQNRDATAGADFSQDPR